ncbi:hypothetical protein GCM10007981_02840 [Thermocladium modestius]|uniref:TRASH domain-containing protein n=1 Tax=Thermocladium modestius TaxID=62609 RepID=A0A830GTE0_9CREN|nr:YHS domain-containing protein [Thermocladium modestius]GGP19382.1 hypothetical protein GCM10007981_02840 [Thermocladium modestius]
MEHAGNRDPVCGMMVESTTRFKSLFRGRVYYFCSESCKRKFDSNPEKYLSGNIEPMQ